MIATALARLARAAGHVLHGLRLARAMRGMDAAGRHACVRAWSLRLLELLGVRLEVRGEPAPGGRLLVANHLSWLDIVAIHAVCPEARFVSKAEVRAWPLIADLIEAGGTLYIERQRTRDAVRVAHAMTQALSQGDTVAVFPEGGIGDGLRTRPFHAGLLQAAISAGVPVQPVALRYSSAAALYDDDTTLLQSLWRVVRARGLGVRLQWLPPQAAAGAERRALAARLQQSIDEALEA